MKVFAEKMKSNSSKEKDFAVAAAKRRKGQEDTDAAVDRILAIDLEFVELEKHKSMTSWSAL